MVISKEQRERAKAGLQTVFGNANLTATVRFSGERAAEQEAVRRSARSPAELATAIRQTVNHPFLKHDDSVHVSFRAAAENTAPIHMAVHNDSTFSMTLPGTSRSWETGAFYAQAQLSDIVAAAEQAGNDWSRFLDEMFSKLENNDP